MKKKVNFTRCPDCKLTMQERSLKHHRGNRTCSAIKHSQIMLSKGYERVYAYVFTLRRLGVKVISETDAKSCVHIGNGVNTYRYGWTNPRAAGVINSLRDISGYLSVRDRNRLIKEGLVDDKVFLSLQDSCQRSNFWLRDWSLSARSLDVTLKVYAGQDNNRRHFVTYLPNGTKEPCCKLPETDTVAVEVASSFGLCIPLCVKWMLQREK